MLSDTLCVQGSQPLMQRIVWPQMSQVRRWRKPGLNVVTSHGDDAELPAPVVHSAGFYLALTGCLAVLRAREIKNCKTAFWNLKSSLLSDYHFTFPSAMYEDSSFSTSSPTLAIVCRFDGSHPSGYEMVSHCGFDSHVPMASDGEHLFMYLWAVCMSTLERGLS